MLLCAFSAYANAEFYVASVTWKDKRCKVEWGSSVLFIPKNPTSHGVYSVTIDKPLQSDQLVANAADFLADFLAKNICAAEWPGKSDVQYPLLIKIEIMSLADATKRSADFLTSNSVVILYTDKSFEAQPASKTEDTVTDSDTLDIDDLVVVEKDPGFDYTALAQRVVYPVKAREDNIEGQVVLGILIGANGVATKCVVLESANSILNESAAKAALLTKFDPAIQNGKPVRVWVRIPISFKLR